MSIMNSPRFAKLKGYPWFVAGALVLCAAAPLLRSGGRVVEASSKEGRQAGAVLFHEKGCEHCHGVDGVGTDRAPALTTVGKRRKKAQIEQQIEKGGSGMPAYGEVLQPDEVKWLVEFLHAKRKAPKHPAATAAPVTPAVPAPAAPSASDSGL
jgi:mono/diheme cytochrome c family protein